MCNHRLCRLLKSNRSIDVAYVIFMASAAHGEFQRCKPLVISVCVLVSYMTAVEVLVGWEYVLALEVNTLGNRRLLSVTSTLLLV